MTHCRHWQRAHSSGPSLLWGFAVSAHRAVEEGDERKRREKQRGRRAEPLRPFQTFPHQFPCRHASTLYRNQNKTNNSERNGALKRGPRTTMSFYCPSDSCWVSTLDASDQEDPWKHALRFNWSGKGYNQRLSTRVCRQTTRIWRPTWILALWLGIPEDNEINTATHDKGTITSLRLDYQNKLTKTLELNIWSNQ